MSRRTIDLNCDLGERDDALGVDVDLELLDIVSSANIACGGHAGDEESMRRTVAAAIPSGVALGAHPSYPDRANFGRVACDLAGRPLEDVITSQVEALLRIVQCSGGELTHVKPHGALYHAAMRRVEIAEAVARAIARLGVPLLLVGQAGAPALEIWRDMGFDVAAEAFADRRYEADGLLRERGKADALIDDPVEAAAQAVRIASGAGVLTATGAVTSLRAETICLHSDRPSAIANARTVRDALARAGVRVQALRQ